MSTYYLMHHGVEGQQWGKRNGPPYPLDSDGKADLRAQKKEAKADKQLKKALAGKKAVTLSSGHEFRRITSNSGADNKDDLMYVNATDEKSDLFTVMIGANKLQKDGKAFAQKYASTDEIKIPSLKEQRKIETGLLKDEKVRNEIIDDLVNKGCNREFAVKTVNNINSGKESVELALGSMGVMSMYGAYIGLAASMNPLGAAVGGIGGAVLGGVVGTALGVSDHNDRKDRQSRMISNTLGNKDNKATREKLTSDLQKKGYNAIRDINDRNNPNIKGTSALIITSPNQNTKLTNTSTIDKETFAKAYSKFRYNSLSKEVKSYMRETDYIKDGEKQYDLYMEQYKKANK